MTSNSSPSEVSSDTRRYAIGRLLGTGNAGAVYLAEDRDTGEQIALKKLLNIDAKHVLRLKREFRSLANVHHPNLVKLYDLGHSADTWFLTMEFVDGPDLLTYLGVRDEVRATGKHTPRRVAIEHLSGIFYQLACGVYALHRANVLHRDLKPSNVLVAHGRVVVLDFGLARGLDSSDLQVTQDGSVSGTPAYMPPEQALGLELREVSDWYAFGAMFYQALSGRLPIDGRNATDLLQRKLEHDPQPLERLGLHVPKELSDLCMRLLARDPGLRPNGDEVLAAFGAFAKMPANQQFEITQTRTEMPRRTDMPQRMTASVLFGRERELSSLHKALEVARRGEPVLVHVRGASGAGKTALVEQFLEALDASSEARPVAPLVLRSRCYEREAMPFKALDGLMDALVNHMCQLDDFDVAHLLPADIADLVRLFPVLERLRAVPRLLANSKPHSDGVQSRTRAELALRELYMRLSVRRPLVLWIDDLQWGDLDSASVLSSWLPHMGRASILLLFSYRSEELQTSSCLRVLLDSGARASSQAYQQIFELAPLQDSDVEQLCLQRLGPNAAQAELVQRIIREAHGSPFLATQLTTLAAAQLERNQPEIDALSMEKLVVQTTALLSDEARAVLHVLAIAGRPIHTQTALRAAGVQRDGNVHLHALKTLRLIRTREVAGERRLEVYHDRVREGVQAAMSADERKAVYEQLQRELESSAAPDPDWLHVLSLGAGQPKAALRYGLVAADRASSTLAFERAAELYRTCIDLSDPEAVSGDLWRKLALSLARCRRGVEAAQAYVQAAKRLDPKLGLPLLRLASSHLLRSGQFEEGERLVDEVLRGYGHAIPGSQLGRVAGLALERTRVALRRGRYVSRVEAEVQSELREQIELFASLTVDTLAHDPVRASWFEARCARLALQAGDPSSLVRSMCISATLACVTGTERAAARSQALLTQAEALCRPSRHGRLERYVHASRAVCSFLLGHPLQALGPSQHAEELYRQDTQRDEQAEYYHLFTVLSVRIGALAALGDHSRMLSELDQCVERAHATDNRSWLLHLTLYQTLADQLRGRAPASRKRLDQERKLLPTSRFGSLHVLHMTAVMAAANATSDYAWAERVVEPMWTAYRHSIVRHSAYLGLVASSEHARMLLNQQVDEAGGGYVTSLVAADLHTLESNPLRSVASATAQCIRARVAYLSGRPEQAIELLRPAIDVFDAEGHRPSATVARYALGRMLPQAAGAELAALAQRQLTEQGIIAPLAYLQRHWPELFAAGTAR